MFIAIYAVLLYLVTDAVLGVTLEQGNLTITKEEGKKVFIHCNVRGLSTTYVHWYQQKDGEALRRILYVGTGKPIHDADYRDAKEFDAKKKELNYELKITNLKKDHSAVYYCAGWERDHSGSKYYWCVQKP